MEPKYCKKCDKKLVRRSDERLIHFNNRKCCNQSCANSYTQGEKNRKRVVIYQNDTLDKFLRMKL